MRSLVMVALLVSVPAHACPVQSSRRDFLFPTTTCLPANPSLFVTGYQKITIAGADSHTYEQGNIRRIDVDASRGTFELIVDFGHDGLQRMYRVGCPFFPYANVEHVEALEDELLLRVESNASVYRIEYDGQREHWRQGHELRVPWHHDTERMRVVALFADGSERVLLDRSLIDDGWTRVVMSPWTWLLLLVGAVLVGVPWPSRRRSFV